MLLNKTIFVKLWTSRGGVTLFQEFNGLYSKHRHQFSILTDLLTIIRINNINRILRKMMNFQKRDVELCVLRSMFKRFTGFVPNARTSRSLTGYWRESVLLSPCVWNTKRFRFQLVVQLLSISTLFWKVSFYFLNTYKLGILQNLCMGRNSHYATMLALIQKSNVFKSGIKYIRWLECTQERNLIHLWIIMYLKAEPNLLVD